MNFADFDIRAYLKHFNVPFWEAGSPNVGRGWIGLKCLYCVDDHNHLGINLIYKNFSCWKCSAKGSLITFIQDLEGIAYGAALRRVDDFQSITALEQQEERVRQSSPGPDILPDFCLETLTKNQRSYLSNRGFDPDKLIKTWGLIGGPTTGPWKYRIIIPVYLRDQIVTWIGLDTTGTANAKYKAASLEESYIPTGELVYGADYAGKSVVVVEGPADVWRIGPGAVALLGMAITAQKIEQLVALEAERYFIMLDAEPLAQQNARILAENLKLMGCEVEILELDQGDPGDLSEQEALVIRSEFGLDT